MKRKASKMMLWALPAAMAGEPINGPLRAGNLVDRVLRAARGLGTPKGNWRTEAEL